MDIIILIGVIIMFISFFIMIINTKYTPFHWRQYRSRSKKWAAISLILLLVGLAIIILKAMANGQIRY
ncbi:hypothetical protein [Lactobacillus kalixensis]|uniref:hypothetical protein n=1 Tax=Lactobacillus kalixensis TaxID=227944 RepID=UPI00070B7D4A|nr:hypothetical protein [Lactobacillus kalixensis]